MIAPLAKPIAWGTFARMTLALATKRQAVDQVIELLLEGMALKDAVKTQGMTLSAFNHVLQGDKQAAFAVAKAQEFRADVLVDEAIHLADGDGDPAKVRNQISIRQWAATRFNQKKYGDRVDLNVSQTIEIGSTLAEARARLLPASYQPLTLDAETVELPREIDTGATDKQSVPINNTEAPDIFD